MKSLNNCILLLALLLTMAACSTTRFLNDESMADEQLYVGVKKFNISTADSSALSPDVYDAVFSAINVAPNNCISSPYYRHPFALGLWLYNYAGPQSKGFKRWLFNAFGEEPVLISDVKPETRTNMITNILQNNGYFGSSASYDILPASTDGKKARINYNVKVSRPRTLGKILYSDSSTVLGRTVDSIAKRDHYLQEGSRYSLDSLSATRKFIASRMQNKGYFYFQPEHIEYLADSMMMPGKIAIKMVPALTAPIEAGRQYYVGNITTKVTSRRTRVKDKFVQSNIALREGTLLRTRDIQRTQEALSRTGVFSSVTINATPIDSLKPGQDSVDLTINCMVDQPLEAKIEMMGSSKSNSYIGPGIDLGLSHKNIFGAGEILSTSLFAQYEWQTGRGSAADRANFNSYNFGLKASLAIPRLLAPSWIDRSRRYVNWTRFELSGEILNRPHFFKMVQTSLGLTWQWHANRYSTNELTPLRLTYNKLLNTTEAFDEAMKKNRSVALSFMSQFIPQLSYNYRYERTFDKVNEVKLNATFTEAGNLMYGLWKIFDRTNSTKELFGTPFSQFLKAEAQLVYARHLNSANTIVTRAFIGAAHAYLNSQEVPYREQFYIGGANSIRAFAMRSIGPGSYHSDDASGNSYYDQTGTFRFELNAEWRFRIFKIIHGAVFADAGNVWLLKTDEQRPGGKLTGKNFLNEIALGTGVGLRLDMGVIVARGDLGIGIHAPYDTGKRGYYNMTSFKNSLAFHIAIGYPF